MTSLRTSSSAARQPPRQRRPRRRRGQSGRSVLRHMGWWLMIDKTRVVTMVDHFLHGWAPRTTGHFTCVGSPLGLRVGSTWKCCTGIRTISVFGSFGWRLRFAPQSLRAGEAHAPVTTTDISYALPLRPLRSARGALFLMCYDTDDRRSGAPAYFAETKCFHTIHTSLYSCPLL